ncbi:aldo-keto reductase family 1 member B1-like [Schistocerca cancellata]|uniref:aldo-keto reductase family 1 member B1-like n=1 Tax=Schistocerca cancellata TaxID=274614 RepID=UPI0021196E12|nr:aldo-keto reductase family 1 member B1-like [Schistocerca cancellata]
MTHKLEHVTFFNGHKMPIVGLGTWQSPNGEVGQAVDAALEAGYRHIDTAYAYGNEAEIGQTLKKWFDSGRLKREDVFIVTKLPFNGNRAESVEKYLKKSLEALQLEYVDLYLIHHPVGHLDVDGSVFPRDQDGKLLIDMNTDHISLWKKCCTKKNVWQLFPLASSLSSARRIVQLSPMSDPVVVDIAQRHGKTPAQVLLRHLMQHRIVVIPKSVKPERIQQNFDVFDFELTPEDMEKLDTLDMGPKGRMFGDSIGPERLRHPEYPFKERY